MSYLFDGPGQIIRQSQAITLANLQAKGAVLTGTFNVGAALPANARLVDAEINVTQAFAGAGLSSAVLSIEGTGDGVGSIILAPSGTSPGLKGSIGTNPYASRGSQQITCTAVTTVAFLSVLTAGAFTVNLFYTVVS